MIRFSAPLLALFCVTNTLCAEEQQFGDFKYTSDDSAVTITSYTGKGGAVRIPEKIAELPVRNFQWMLYGNESVTSITIPASVTSIADDCISYCANLTTISVDEANAKYSGFEGVLFNKARTELLAFPRGKVGSYIIPDSVTSFGHGAFAVCTGLTSVAIPEGVTSIHHQVFRGCTGLTSISIPKGVTSIGVGAFERCKGLTSVTFPDSLISIKRTAFVNCTGLTSIGIPGSVTEIGGGAFQGCSGLTSATFEGNAPSRIAIGAFHDTAPGFTIRYYKGATGFTTPEWNGYKTVEIDPATELFDWTSKDSKIIKANFGKLDGEAVVVRTEDGKEHKIPFTRLSPASVAQAKMLGGGSR